MKRVIFYIFFITPLFSFAQNGDDGWNIRELSSFQNADEPARISITLKPGFDTQGHPVFHAYVDPDLPLNGGIPVNDGLFNMNFIREYTPIHDNATNDVPDHLTLNYNDWAENITYFDGLGRPIQKVSVKGTAAGTDLIQPIVYDDYGRIKQEYLPYGIAQLGGGGGGPGNPATPGGYRPVFLPEQKAFYNIYNPGQEDYTFAEKDFDGSPINRVMKQGYAGSEWDLENLETGHPVQYEYHTNTANEILILGINSNNQLQKQGYYEPARLFKNVTIDENNHQSVEYKDLSGNVVCKKTYDNSEWLITYYAYDDFGLLRYVIPPQEYFSLLNQGPSVYTFDFNEDWILQYCFYYQYDERKRMTIKRLPGVQPVYMVYNKRDQLVLTQDGNQRENFDWLFTKYDVFNRPVITGIYNNPDITGQENMQDEVNNEDDLYEVFNGTGEHGYTDDAFPGIVSPDCEIYTVTYYGGEVDENDQDVYDYIVQNFGADFDYHPSEIDFMYNRAEGFHVKGLVAATKTAILPNTDFSSTGFLKSVNYYDIYKRVIQTVSDNNVGGMDTVSNKINFTGDILLTKETHSDAANTYIVQTKFEYDNGKRLTKTMQKIDGAADFTVLSHNKYDELGRVRHKHLHGSSGNSLQTVDYKYNIRDWLTDINDINNLGNDLFAMHLGYTSTSYQNPQYNGNIAAMQWKTGMYGLADYEFVYDGANRLLSAVYSGTGSYETHYSYDRNGNILTLSREGKLGSSSNYDMIDELTYDYNGNQLKYVNDVDDNNSGSHHQNNGFSDNGSFLTTDEYYYDANGNMIQDVNKSMDIQSYNHLNLPQKILFNTSGGDNGFNTISYLYDAAGTKLSKKTKIANIENSTTDYSGNFIYRDNQLACILTPEGRALPDGNGGFEYQYYLKDHLGNTRIMFDQNKTVLQNYSYYPFGMEMGGFNYMATSTLKNKYLYNSKEMQDDFGLEWYDYGARFYDAEIGRWHSVDPVAEWYIDFTPYAYVGNNPISFMDPDGNFRTRFGAWWYKLWNGGDGIGKDKGGEYFVYTDNNFVDDEGVVNVSSTRVFDKNGRSEGKDMELDAAKEAYITQMNFQHSMEEMGVEVYYTKNRTEAISSMLQIPSMVIMPNLLKGTTGVVNAAKQGNRIKAGSIKELKSLIKQLSKLGSELTKKELRQLTKLVEKYGGKIRKDLNPVKGRIKKPHVQVEGLGKSIESRHVWLKSGVN